MLNIVLKGEIRWVFASTINVVVLYVCFCITDFVSCQFMFAHEVMRRWGFVSPAYSDSKL